MQVATGAQGAAVAHARRACAAASSGTLTHLGDAADGAGQGGRHDGEGCFDEGLLGAAVEPMALLSQNLGSEQQHGGHAENV